MGLRLKLFNSTLVGGYAVGPTSTNETVQNVLNPEM